MVGQENRIQGRSGAAVGAVLPCALFLFLLVFLLLRAGRAGNLNSLHVLKREHIKGVGKGCPICPWVLRIRASVAPWAGQVGANRLPWLPLLGQGPAL